MTKKQLCKMCVEYSSDIKCDNKNNCELQNILSENKKLKEEVKRLKKENKDLLIEKSWRMSPDMMGK